MRGAVVSAVPRPVSREVLVAGRYALSVKNEPM